MTSPPERRWLLFVYQLPPRASNLRVRTWRRLQQVGAVPARQAVYVLPDTPAAREDFEWLRSEVQASRGEASVFAADSVDAWSDDALVDAFRQAGHQAYAGLALDVERLLKRIEAPRRRQGSRAPAAGRLLQVFRERLVAVERADHFGSVGRDRVLSALRRLEARIAGPSARTTSGPVAPADASRFQSRLWMTRPRPGVDRMASAWLVRRFIDARARFGFAIDRESIPADAVPYDMFGVEFSHHGGGCTFETLCAAFALHEPAVVRLAAIVHDLDLKDGRFGAPEASTVGLVIEGLQFAHADDHALLEQGILLFDSLYRSFEQSARVQPPVRPRAGRKATSPRRRPRG